jgi:hypothetical protein
VPTAPPSDASHRNPQQPPPSVTENKKCEELLTVDEDFGFKPS